MELGFAWHHSKQPHHARLDFEHMIDCNCNSVLIALSEDDLAYWYPNMMEIIDEAKTLGLKVWVNFWAFGGVFGGEPPSSFLHHNHAFRQITAESKEAVPAACINRSEFRDYLFDSISRVIKDGRPNGVFLDEPHYYYMIPDMSEFTCTCEVCQSKYEEETGTQMPIHYDDSVREFRQRSMLSFLVETCKTIKLTSSSTEVCVCVIPNPMESLGTPDWDTVSSIPEVDIFSTDPYYHIFGRERKWAIQAAKRTIKIAKIKNKQSQLWLQMFRLPRGQESEVASLVSEYAAMGVDSIFGWCYLANKGTTITSDEPDLLWSLIVEEYRKLVT